MKKSKGFVDIEMIFYLIIAIIFIILIIGGIYFSTLNYRNKKNTICVVKDKWVKPSSKSSKYLVQCNNEVYEITDLFFKGKFNSSDIYIKLKKGHKYKITTTGYRIRFFSQYKNINKVKELKEGNK